MIKSILIANRGEIACRIAKTCNRLGIATYGIATLSDLKSRHTRIISHIFQVSSYLNIPEIIGIVKSNTIEAVHPGYGFLSERSEFVTELKKIGVVYIGADAEAMLRLGDKVNGRELAESLQIPLLQGYSTDTLPADLIFPLLIKSAAGGGGRGMRVVNNRNELVESIHNAKIEALNSFGNDKLFIERYLNPARHIEIQVIGDIFGNVKSLGSRDCSIQRSYQKIIEEAPATNLSAITLANMEEAGCLLVKSANYHTLATVEFLVDENDNFYFLEVNTRLQVEHTVTEEIYNIDLVELQLKLAVGKSIPEIIPNPVASGVAIQLRICAERPEIGFKPESGFIRRLSLPANSIRIDSGFDNGDQVTTDFDSLIAKMIIHHENRQLVVGNLIKALESFSLVGLATNIPFLTKILETKEFANGNYNLNLVTRVLPEFSNIKEARIEALFYGIGAVLWQNVNYQNNLWCLNFNYIQNLEYCCDKILFKVAIITNNNSTMIKINSDDLVDYSGNRSDFHKLSFKLLEVGDDDTFWIQHPYGTFNFTKPNYSLTRYSTNRDISGDLYSLLPGKVVVLGKFAIGDTVQQGDIILIIESMKMQHQIVAKCSGILDELNVSLGKIVKKDEFLARIRVVS
jgi:acetyl/propionyl-CoA carboxylase alpha subunit